VTLQYDRSQSLRVLKFSSCPLSQRLTWRHNVSCLEQVVAPSDKQLAGVSCIIVASGRFYFAIDIARG
jgi:hypothetical protein